MSLLSDGTKTIKNGWATGSVIILESNNIKNTVPFKWARPIIQQMFSCRTGAWTRVNNPYSGIVNISYRFVAPPKKDRTCFQDVIDDIYILHSSRFNNCSIFVGVAVYIESTQKGQILGPVWATKLHSNLESPAKHMFFTGHTPIYLPSSKITINWKL